MLWTKELLLKNYLFFNWIRFFALVVLPTAYPIVDFKAVRDRCNDAIPSDARNSIDIETHTEREENVGGGAAQLNENKKQ